MKKFLLAPLFMALMLGSSLSHAAAQYCYGTISQAYVSTAGELFVNGTWRNDFIQVCNLTASWKGISNGVCKEWYSMIQAAVVSKSPVTVSYNSAPACSALSTYASAPSPYYFMMHD